MCNIYVRKARHLYLDIIFCSKEELSRFPILRKPVIVKAKDGENCWVLASIGDKPGNEHPVTVIVSPPPPPKKVFSPHLQKFAFPP